MSSSVPFDPVSWLWAAAKSVPTPEVAVAAVGVLLLVGDFCVLTGIQPHAGLSCIALFLVCITPQSSVKIRLLLRRIDTMRRLIPGARTRQGPG